MTLIYQYIPLTFEVGVHWVCHIVLPSWRTEVHGNIQQAQVWFLAFPDRRKGQYASRTFRSHADAQRWVATVERQIDAIRYKANPCENQVRFVADIIDLHLIDMRVGGGGNAPLDQLRRGLGHYRVDQLTRGALIEFGKRRPSGGAGPVTLSIDISYIRTVLMHASAVHGLPVSVKAVDQARFALKQLGLIGRGHERTLRPATDELNRLFKYFDASSRQTIPMSRIVRFAVATGMRQNEICRLSWSDVDLDNRTALSRNRKHPREKSTNDQTVALVVDAGWDPIILILEQARLDSREDLVFPYNSRSIGTAFRRGCRALGIEDLHFHDLRHEAASRLFGTGYQMPEVSLVTGHKDWKMLQRHTNLKPEDLAKRMCSNNERSMPGGASPQMLGRTEIVPINFAPNGNGD